MCLCYTDECYLPRPARCTALSHYLRRVTASPFQESPGHKLICNIYGHKVSLVVFWCLVPYAHTGQTNSAGASQGPTCTIVDIQLIQLISDIFPFPLPFFSLLSGTRNSVFLILQSSAPRFPQTESNILNLTARQRGAVEAGAVEIIHPSQHWAAALLITYIVVLPLNTRTRPFLHTVWRRHPCIDP